MPREYGVRAPGRTAPALVARLHSDFLAVMNSDDVKTVLAKLGLWVRTSSRADFSALVEGDLKRWRKAVTDARITAD